MPGWMARPWMYGASLPGETSADPAAPEVPGCCQESVRPREPAACLSPETRGQGHGAPRTWASVQPLTTKAPPWPKRFPVPSTPFPVAHSTYFRSSGTCENSLPRSRCSWRRPEMRTSLPHRACFAPFTNFSISLGLSSHVEAGPGVAYGPGHGGQLDAPSRQVPACRAHPGAREAGKRSCSCSPFRGGRRGGGGSWGGGAGKPGLGDGVGGAGGLRRAARGQRARAPRRA